MDGRATATKLGVLSAPGCECRECTFIRHAYACHCPTCGRGWQEAFATAEAAQEAMALHAKTCRPWVPPSRRVQKTRPPRPAYYPAFCGWCGESWPKRFTTKGARERFMRGHVRGCYLTFRAKETA